MLLTDFTTLTFDCYGTLIDWETGIHTALKPLLAAARFDLDKEAVLAIFAQHESRQQAATPDMLYAELLAVVHGQLAKLWGVRATAAENRRFGQSVPDWPAFDDSAAALRYLKQYYQLVILSNVDRESFKGSNRQLGVAFDAIYTAQDIGAYKPDPRNFDYMLARLAERGIGKRAILHTAQSLFHDHVPANAVGLASAWIDRRQCAEGWGATMPPSRQPKVDFQFPSMKDFAAAHQAALGAAG